VLTDHLAESGSPYTLLLGPCPSCGQSHEVTLSRLGRFAYRCGRVELCGRVDDFIASRRAYERAADGAVLRS